MMKSRIRRTKWLFTIFTIAFLFSELTLSMNAKVEANSSAETKELMQITNDQKRKANLIYQLNETRSGTSASPGAVQSFPVSIPAISTSESLIEPIETQMPTPIITKKTKKSKKKKERKKEKLNKKKGKVYSSPPGTFKSFMSYKRGSQSIFGSNTPQYRLQQKAYTGKNGIRMVKERYCVAVGSRYAEKIGTKLDIELKSGKVIKCILADQKSDNDTDSTNSYHLCDNSVAEFIVDFKILSSRVKRSGNIGSIGKNFSGPISHIRVYK